MPFLTILLPMRMTALVGADDLTWLAIATIAGAVTASIANIVFGWASDRSGSRVPWIAMGLVSSCALLVGFAAASTPVIVIGLLVAWQCALNMLLASLAAWAGDCVPDRQKGSLGGLLAFAPAAGAGAGVLITLPGLAQGDARLWLVAAMVGICVAPVLLFGRPRSFPELMRDGPEPGAQVRAGSQAARMWIARLLIQVSEAALFAFLYFWLRSIDPGMTDARVAQTFGAILFCAAPIALMTGRWADRRERPFAPLSATAAGATAGLLMMALAPGLALALAGYVVFGLSASIFLSLHSAQTLRVLPRAAHRGRDLGIFNLTNTAPSVAVPWLTLALVPSFGFTGLFVALAGCAFVATLLLARLPRSA